MNFNIIKNLKNTIKEQVIPEVTIPADKLPSTKAHDIYNSIVSLEKNIEKLNSLYIELGKLYKKAESEYVNLTYLKFAENNKIVGTKDAIKSRLKRAVKAYETSLVTNDKRTIQKSRGGIIDTSKTSSNNKTVAVKNISSVPAIVSSIKAQLSELKKLDSKAHDELLTSLLEERALEIQKVTSKKATIKTRKATVKKAA